MESSKETFQKFISRIDGDMVKMEAKSLEEIKDLKNIYKSLAEVENLLISCTNLSNKIAKELCIESPTDNQNTPISENSKNDEGNERKFLQSHKSMAIFPKRSEKIKDSNGLKINKINEAENKGKQEENEKKNYPKTPIKNKEFYSTLKPRSNLNNFNEVEISLTKTEITPNLTRSVTKALINSPVKHTISSLNKARLKENIILEKKSEDEFDNRYLTQNKTHSLDLDGKKIFKSEISAEDEKEKEKSKTKAIIGSSQIMDENRDSFQSNRDNFDNHKFSKKSSSNLSVSQSKANFMTRNSNKILDSMTKNKERLNTDGMGFSTEINVKVNKIKEEDNDDFNNSNSRKSISSKSMIRQSSSLLDKKQNKIEKKVGRDKTPFIKEKAEKIYNKIANSLKTPDKQINMNSELNNEENISKNINNSSISINNNRKSIQNKKSSYMRGSGINYDGKSLMRKKTEKIITSNFISGNDFSTNHNSYFDKEKNKKSVKKEKPEAFDNNKTLPGILKSKENVMSKNSNNSITQQGIEDEKANKPSSLNGNQMNREKMPINEEIHKREGPKIKLKPKNLFFKKLKLDLTNSITKYFDANENKNIILKINKSFSKIALNNLINFITAQKLEQESKFEVFKSKYKIEELTKEPPKFTISRGSMKAIEMLNEQCYRKTFTDKIMSNDEILLVYRIYFQLFDFTELVQIKDNQQFFEKVCEYFTQKSDGKIGELITNNIKLFDFSSENIFKINKMIGSNLNKISPAYYSKICGTTGLILFLLKDIMEYSGITIVDKKTPIQRVYNNFNYNLDIFNSKIYRLNYYLTRYHV